MTTERPGCHHCGLAAHPGPRRLDRLPRTLVSGLSSLEQGQDVLSAGGCPKGKGLMVGIGERRRAEWSRGGGREPAGESSAFPYLAFGDFRIVAERYVESAHQLGDPAGALRGGGVSAQDRDECGSGSSPRCFEEGLRSVRNIRTDEFCGTRGVRCCAQNVIHLSGVRQGMEVHGRGGVTCRHGGVMSCS
ncbi:hypothetical protein OG617_16065 [Micromonospora sp. NBC_01412]